MPEISGENLSRHITSKKNGLNQSAAARIKMELDRAMNPSYEPSPNPILDAANKAAEEKNNLEDNFRKAREENIRLVEENTRLVESNLSLKKMAFIDGMTGLYNRNFYNSYLKNVDPERDDRNLGFVFIDLNFLKKANDEHGYEAGDQLLRATADVLKKVVRKGDILTRLDDSDVSPEEVEEDSNNLSNRIGGDEFVVVCHNTSGNSNFSESFIESITTRLNNAVDSYNQKRKPGTLPLSISIGAAVYNKIEDAGDIQNTIKKAELAMKANKLAMKANRE